MATSRDAPMVRICPVPLVWASLYQQLQKHAANRACEPATPPVPLILGGWIHSNDMHKQVRWSETVACAEVNGAGVYVAALRSTDFYKVEHPSNVAIGPTGGPMYLTWSCATQGRGVNNPIYRRIKSRTTIDVMGPRPIDAADRD